MKKISTSIPTIIKNSQPTKDLPPSVVIFQHNNLIEAR
jgi:hypothetical protein